MNNLSVTPGLARLAVFRRPYDRFEEIDTQWTPTVLPPRGQALLWFLRDGQGQQSEFEWLLARAHGLPLFVVLPPPNNLYQAMPLLRFINALAPRGVLPLSTIVAPSYIEHLLTSRSSQLPTYVTRYLMHRNLLVNSTIRHDVELIFRCAPQTASVSALARRLCTSRRTLGRHFAAAGLPVPSHWLQLARLLHAIVVLQKTSRTVSRVASQLGYPDGFTMSNQMKRLLGYRPSEIRQFRGWEWIVETWIKQEVIIGGIDHFRHRPIIEAYLPK